MSDQPTVPFPAAPRPPDRQRTAWRVTLIAVLAAVVLALPFSAYLIARDRGGGEGSPPAAPAPSTSAPPVSPPVSPPASPTVSPEPDVPDGHIALSTLRNTTLFIPPWPTDNVRGPSGRLRFRDGIHRIDQPAHQPAHGPATGSALVILSVTYGDVDRDGTDETVAEIGCIIEGGSKQLVAFDRDSLGRIVTLGPVVATTGEIRDIATGSARVAGGVVTARVADFQRCCDDNTPQVWQKRGYRWRDGRFHQVSGPTVMTPNPYVTEISLAAGEIVLGPPVDGYRSGTLTVTVRHLRGSRPAKVTIGFSTGARLEPTGTSWPPITTAPSGGWFGVTVGGPPGHGTVTRTFALRRAATAAGGSLEVDVTARNPEGAAVAEPIGWNNGATVPVRTVD